MQCNNRVMQVCSMPLARLAIVHASKQGRQQGLLLGPTKQTTPQQIAKGFTVTMQGKLCIGSAQSMLQTGIMNSVHSPGLMLMGKRQIALQGWGHRVDCGDVDKCFESGECDHVIEGTCKMGGQEHFYLEPHGSIVVPSENDEIKIIASTQVPPLP